MNFVRRRPGNDHSREIPSGSSAECAHLGRLFNQYRQIQDVAEQDQMFYELLPVFHGVLADCKPTEFIEKFPDIHAFCSRATQILVKEIKSRAANQTSEEGSRQIFLYLEPPDHVPCSKPVDMESVASSPLNVESRGWNLLSCLNVLSSGHMSLIECMVAASLPSTLVKCMYIFLDLPRASNLDKAHTFQLTFKQIVQRLCMYPIAVEELSRKDALCHLFSASTDWCPPHNVIWRSTTAAVLSTIAQNGMTTVVVKYIHDSKCIVECIRNISQGRLAPLEILDSFIALLHILCESSSLSHFLMDDFCSNNGYSVTTEFVLKLEQNFSHTETKQALQTIVSLLERLVVCGAVELRPKPGAGEQIHAFPGFRVPMPKSAAKKSVRNILAFDVLQSLFLSASTKELSMLLLDTIKTIYLQDLANYFILEQQNTLVLFVKKIYHKPTEIQEAFFNLLEVLVTKLHYVPMKEISSIVVLMKTCGFNYCLALTLRHLIKLLGEHRLFKEVYHDVGLLELSIELLNNFADMFGDPPEPNSSLEQSENTIMNGTSPDSPVTFEVGQLLVDFLRLTVSGSVPNADMCLRLGLANCVAQRLLPSRPPANTIKWRRHALAILEEIMLTNGGEQVMPLLLNKMHTTYVDLKLEVLRSFCRVLRESHRCRIVFRKVNGFVYVMQELINLESCLNPRSRLAASSPMESKTPEDRQHHVSRNHFLASLTYEQIFKLVRIIFTVFGIAMKFEPANAHYFATEIQYSNITDAIISLGSFSTSSYFQSETPPSPNSTYRSGDKGNTIGHSLFTTLFRNLHETETLLVTNCTSSLTNPIPPFITFHAPSDLANQYIKQSLSPIHVPRHIVECCVLTRYLYNLAVDAYDKRSVHLSLSEKQHSELQSNIPSFIFPSPKSSDSNAEAPCPSIVHPGAIISLLHMAAMFDQRRTDQSTPPGNLDIDFQTCLLDVVSDLLRLERNQQLMCTVQMPRELITLFREHLANEASPLHDRIQALFECLVVQALSPNDLREYLRISDPLCCRSSELIESASGPPHDHVAEVVSALQNAGSRCGGPLPLSQVKFLIATATPVNAQLVRPTCDAKSLDVTPTSDPESEPGDSLIRCTLVPPFVEFDMNPEGFGCLYLPSIAPQGPSSVANLSGATSCSDLDAMTGGVGAGERPFPPPHGFTLSTWVCVSRFDTIRTSITTTSIASDGRSRSDSQPPSEQQQPQAVHLFTIVRGIQSVNDQLICLRIFIHPFTRMLVVSTQERLAQPDQTTDSELGEMATGEHDRRPSLSGTSTLSMDSTTTSSCAVFPCGLPNSTEPQQWPVGVWRHLAVVFSRAGMIKSSSCSVYLDGQLVGVQRLNYIGSSAAVSSFLGRQTMPSTVCAFVGTPATERRPSTLVWRQGPMHFMEEPLQANRIAYIARLGPNYFGSFQSPPPVVASSSGTLEEPYHPLLSEEKLVFGIYASTQSTLTLSRFRKIYNQADTKAVARQFYIAPKENVTPIRVLHNSAAHLHGPARPLGAVLVGYQGVRAFSPNPVVRQLHCVGGGVGGIRIGLALIAMAQDAETLYAATKAACTLIRSSPAAANEMRITRGYQMLAMLLRKKRHLLTTRILDTILGLTMNLDSWMDGATQEQFTAPPDHPAFEDLLCDLDLWRVERERIESSGVSTAGQDLMDAGTTKRMVIEEDYRLVTNLLNHLVELLSVTSSRHKRGSIDSCNSNGFLGHSNVPSEHSLHPTWNLVFDRIFYLLLSAHQTPSGSSSIQSRPGFVTTTLVFERQSMLDATMKFFHIYFSHSVPSRSVLHIAQLMVWTLPPMDINERIIPLEESLRANGTYSAELIEYRRQLIGLRNACFHMLLKLIVTSPSINKRFCNELLTVVGFDWFHLFFRPNVHSSSVVLGFHLLILVILNPDYSVVGSDPVEDWLQEFESVVQHKSQQPSVKSQHDNSTNADGSVVPSQDTDGLSAFRIGCPAGRWLRGCEALLKRQHGLLLDNVPRNPKYISARFLAALRDFRLTACQQSGFGVLRLLLPQHSDVPELFYLLTALLLQLPVRHIPTDFHLEFDSLYSFLSHRKDSNAFHPLTESDGPGTTVAVSTTSSMDMLEAPQSPDTSSGVGGLVSSFLTVAGFGRRRSRGVSASDSNVDVVCSNANTTPLITDLGPPLCPEAAYLLLALIRSLLSREPNLTPKVNWTEDYSEVTLRFLVYLYRSNLNFRSIAMNAEFINGLVGISMTSSGCRVSQKTDELNPQNCQLSSSPVQDQCFSVIRKISLDFLKTIVSDSFMLPPCQHQSTNMVDILLEALSDHCRSKHYDELGTHVLCELMEHFIATDLLTDETLCVPSGGDCRFIPSQLVYFCARVVDKLWQGSFGSQLIKLVDFLIYLINQWPARRHQAPGITGSELEQTDQRFGIESLFRSLNRAILYQFSRPILTRTDQLQILELFKHIQSSQPSMTDSSLSAVSRNSMETTSTDAVHVPECNSILFSPGNEDPDFPACLIHLLMQLVRVEQHNLTTANHSTKTSTPNSASLVSLAKIGSAVVNVEPQMQRTSEVKNYYHTTFLEAELETSDEAVVASQVDKSAQQTEQAENSVSSQRPRQNESNSVLQVNSTMIVQAALQLWAECYLAKKQLIATLVPDTPLVSGLSVPSLTDWAAVLESPCLMAWAQHVDSEAAGTGGTGPESLWGRIPGPPSADLSSVAPGLGSSPPVSRNSNVQSSAISGLHHQISLRLSRIPGSVFKFGSGAQSVSGTPSGATPVSGESAAGSSSFYTTPSSSQVPKSCIVAHPVQTPNLESVRDALETCVPNQLAYLRDMLEQQRKQHHRNMGFIQRRLELEWEKMELELTRERGLWGPTRPDPLVRWKLDPTEGPCRMRKRMIPNPTFYMRYPYHPLPLGRASIYSRSSVIGSPIPHIWKSRQPRSRFSQLYFLNYQSRSILHKDWGPLTPWLPLLAEKDKAARDSQSLALDTMDTNELEEAVTDDTEQQDDLETSLRRSLDPEELDQSLKNTVSLLRLTGKSSQYTHDPAETDDVDEVIAPSGDNVGDMGSMQGEQTNAPLAEEQPADETAQSSPSTRSADSALVEQVKNDQVPNEPTAPASVPSYSSVTIDNDKQLASHEAILRLLEPGERPTVMYRCARILGLDVYEGLLLFGQAHFYVIDGYTLINTREIVEIDSLPPDVIHEPVVPCMHGSSNTNTAGCTLVSGERASVRSHVTDLWSTGAVSQTSGKQYFKFPYENIQDVYKRRYLLQPIALEVFNTDGRNFLLAFSKGLQGKVYQRFQNVATLNSIAHPLMNQKNTPSLLSSLLGEKTVTQRWERGELSNFQYLMYLNTQAGRSYNDLMQYPIFPWVLADYDSEELDLTCPETFRDFSKPMGAQTARRLQQFHRRFKEWDDPTGETPPYHYGTHYSSAMIVASYLVRMEPFTQQFLKLQGGHFDLPDRMFHSVKHAWLSASEQNMADVRELIPEFFYLPDFLVNSNQFELGLKQNGRSIDDVVLPAWAKSDPREFIRAHREALESEYVSAHLHEWIDLIFGYKQQGDAAVQAFNVFHHLFYEGNVDIYSIDDPLKRSAVIGFINNFGQIPKQLFRKPHPSRRIVVPRGLTALFLGSAKRVTSGTQIAADLFYRNIDCLRPHLQPLKELKHAVGQMIQLDPSLVPSGSGGSAPSAASAPAVGGRNPSDSSSGGGGVFGDGLSTPPSSNPGPVPLACASIVAVEQNKCLLPPHHTTYVAWGFTDGSLRLGSPFDPLERARSVFEMVDQAEILCCTAPSERTLVTAGISTVVRVWKLQYVDAQTSRSVPPTTASSSGHDSTSGSNQQGPSNTGSSTSSNAPASACRLQLRANLCGHTEAVTCLAASNAFNLVVSGSRDRTCILWDLTRLCFLRQLTGHVAPIAAVCISEATGDIASCAGTYLYLWNCNGEPIASVDTMVGRNKQILCVCMSTLYDWDAENVVLTGGSDGVVRMWGVEYTRLDAVCQDDVIRSTEVERPLSSNTVNVVHNSTTPSADTAKLNDENSPNAVTSSGDQSILEQPGWTRELVCRGKLTMHTAYGRSDNQQPAAITALAISRDHRSVLVGDARGRVHAWSVPNEASRGGMTDQWVRDEVVTNCATETCGVKFSLTERKHHCRNCGKVFCNKCSRFEIEIHRLRIFKRVRVCHMCFTMLQVIQAPKIRPRPESTRVDL